MKILIQKRYFHIHEIWTEAFSKPCQTSKVEHFANSPKAPS